MRALALLALPALVLAQPADAKAYFSIYTREAAKLVRWYSATFGLRPVRTERPEGTSLSVTLLDGELLSVEIIGRPDLPPPFPASQRPGFSKIGIEVSDLSALLSRWRNMDVTIAAGPFDDPQAGVRSVLLRDPDGNVVQVSQPLAPAN